jgi:hypothetical protein
VVIQITGVLFMYQYEGKKESMITRIIYTEIWQDEFFADLIPEEKLLFIYYLTNDAVNIIHLYRCSVARVSADTGIDTPIILKAQEKFEKADKIFFNGGYIFLKNAHRFEKYLGVSNETAKAKLFDRLSKKIIAWYNSVSDTPVYTPPMTGTINHKSEIITHKTEINAEQINNEVDEALSKLEVTN